MDRVYNYSAGPSCLPLEVLEEVKNELLNYKNKGYSILEMNHRTKAYDEINDDAINMLKKLLNVKNDYEVIFMQGGAYSQFSIFPMNLAKKDDLTLYTLTGNFSEKAYIEGKKITNAKIITSSKNSNYSFIPEITKELIDQNAKYLHITVNNTAYGTCYNQLPETGDVPLIGDMSSIILSKNYDINKFGLIYGGAQKNLGTAGITFVVIKKNLVNDKISEYIPSIFSYATQIEKKSIFNTPPVFAVYILDLMLHWIEKQGGVMALEKMSIEKSNMLYDLIDNSNFYTGTALKKDRSPVNITFKTPNEDLDLKFIKEAKDYGLINLKGYKSCGGLRASLYNAMTTMGVKKLVEFMKKFEKENEV